MKDGRLSRRAAGCFAFILVGSALLLPAAIMIETRAES